MKHKCDKNEGFLTIVSGRQIISVFVLITLMISFGCRSKTVVKKLSNVNSKTETTSLQGSMYHLPLTVVKVSVPLKLDKKTPGELSDFTPCFFDPDEADTRIKFEKKEVSIDPPTFSPVGIADLDETFVVQTTGSYFESRTVSMTFSGDGSLTDGSIESKDETLPIAIKAVETGVGIVSKFLPWGGGSLVASSSVAGTSGKNKNPDITVTDNKANAAVKINETDIRANAEKIKSRLTEKLINFSLPRIAEEEILAKSTPRSEKSCFITGFIYQIKVTQNKIDELTPKIKELREKLAKAGSESDKIKIQAAIEKLDKNVKKLESEKKEWEERQEKAEEILAGIRNEQNIEIRQFMPFVMLLNKAEKTKKKLDELAEERKQLQTDLPNVNSDVYKTRLAEIDDKIKGLRQLFFGKPESFQWTGNFEFNPRKNGDGIDHKTLFTYSKAGGVCYNGDFKTGLAREGILVSKDVQTECNEGKDELTMIQIYADRLTNDASFISKVSLAKKAMENVTSGWYFRIPAKTTVALIECKNTTGDARCGEEGRTEYLREKMMIAQYGAVVSLPAKTAGRSSTASIALDDKTGALKNFKVSSSPLLDKTTIDDAGKTAETVIDANDPLTKKKRELELLDTQNKINAARKTLEGATPSPTP